MQYFHLRQETCLPPCPHSCSALLSCSEAALSYWVSSCSSTLNCFIIYEHWLKSKALLLISSFKDSMWTHTHTHLTSFMIFILCEMKIRLFAFGVVKVRFTWALFPKLHTWVHSESRVRLVSWNKGGEGGGGEVYYFGVFSHELNM